MTPEQPHLWQDRGFNHKGFSCWLDNVLMVWYWPSSCAVTELRMPTSSRAAVTTDRRMTQASLSSSGIWPFWRRDPGLVPLCSSVWLSSGSFSCSSTIWGHRLNVDASNGFKCRDHFHMFDHQSKHRKKVFPPKRQTHSGMKCVTIKLRQDSAVNLLYLDCPLKKFSFATK